MNGTTSAIQTSTTSFIMFSFGQAQGQTNDVNLFLSNDKGFSWQKQQTLFNSQGYDQFTDPQAVQLPDGTWVMTLKTRIR